MVHFALCYNAAVTIIFHHYAVVVHYTGNCSMGASVTKSLGKCGGSSQCLESDHLVHYTHPL